MLLQKYWVNIKVQTNAQSIDWDSFIQSFCSEIINLLICNNPCEPPVPFMHNQYVPLIICSQKMVKTKEIENINDHHIQPAI